MRILAAPILIGVLLVGGCSAPNVTDEIGLTLVTFPNGVKINAETMRSDVELMRGLMFRESLPVNRGMLFIHAEENNFRYWMYQTKIPLDIIWMDRGRRILEIAANTPPCQSTIPKDCPSYGGNFKARFVLEVNAGVARKNGLKAGDTLEF